MNTGITEHNIVAAILAAGMLPVLPAPSEPGTVSADERKAILGTVQHALGLYAAIQEALRNAVVPDYTAGGSAPTSGGSARPRRSRRDH
jgi:hypothetical protein